MNYRFSSLFQRKPIPLKREEMSKSLSESEWA